METISLLVDSRDGERGKGQTRKLRSQGVVPGVVYKEGTSFPVQASYQDLSHILRQYGENVILQLNYNGNRNQAFIKEVQRHPVTHELLHFDLQPITMHEKMQVNIPIKIEGQKVVEGKGGILQRQMHEIEVEALAKDIPKFIEVDISGLNIGETMQVGDVEISQELTLLSNPQEVVVSITEPTLDNNKGEDELE